MYFFLFLSNFFLELFRLRLKSLLFALVDLFKALPLALHRVDGVFLGPLELLFLQHFLARFDAFELFIPRSLVALHLLHLSHKDSDVFSLLFVKILKSVSGFTNKREELLHLGKEGQPELQKNLFMDLVIFCDDFDLNVAIGNLETSEALEVVVGVDDFVTCLQVPQELIPLLNVVPEQPKHALLVDVPKRLIRLPVVVEVLRLRKHLLNHLVRLLDGEGLACL